MRLSLEYVLVQNTKAFVANTILLMLLNTTDAPIKDMRLFISLNNPMIYIILYGEIAFVLLLPSLFGVLKLA